jgi:flagella basal body P-ring formation protein FlgA
MRKQSALLITSVLLGMMIFAAPTQSAASGIRILLNKVSLAPPDHRVTIGDVAEISGGTPAQREHISALDLDTLEASAKDCRITRRQIELRVMVDGYARNRFEVVGPNEVAIRCSVAKEMRAQLEQLFTKEICRQFGLDEDAVGVRLVNQQQVQTAESKLTSHDFSATVLFQSQLPIGKTQIQVEFAERSGNRFLQEFDSQVIVSMDVAVATRGIYKGSTIEREMIRVIKRPILSREDFADPEQVFGRVAKRDINSNEVVLVGAITSPTTRREPIIKRNDILDVIVRMGRSEIRLKNAKALSQGDVGESIVVLNTRSNKQFSAVVVDRNLAKIAPLLGAR